LNTCGAAVPRLQRQAFRLASVVLIWLFVRSVPAAEFSRTITYLPTANGLCFASYNLKKAKVDAFFPHVSDDWDVASRTPNLVQSISYRLIIGSRSFALEQYPIQHSGYVNGTGIIRIEQRLEKASLISYIWAPMILDHKVLFWVLHIPGANRYRLNRNHFLPYVDPPMRELQTVVRENWDGEDLWLSFAVVFSAGMTRNTQLSVMAELRKAQPKRLLEAEERWWQQWHLLNKEPSSIVNIKHDVFRQSLAFVKMAQCREMGPCFGQIVQSLASGQMKIAITRDMAYSIVALSAAGHYPEARAALKFMLYADAGAFRSHRIGDLEWGLGRSYVVSLSHYAGIGFERAQLVGNSPVLYFCSHPLFLWALHDYYKHSSDRPFLDQVWTMVKQYVLEPLLYSLNEKNLMRADSGLWDVPAPGRHFFYTSASAYQGLTCTAVLARTLGDNETLKRCSQAAVRLRESMLTHLTFGRSKMFVRSLEKKTFPEILDASTMEAVNWGVVNPDWKSAKSTLAALDARLRISPQRGYSLGYVNAKQMGQENPFVTLRIVAAMTQMKRNKDAALILDWVSNQAAVNAEMIPEFYDRTTASYLGDYPVIGMGAAVYLLAAQAVAE